MHALVSTLSLVAALGSTVSAFPSLVIPRQSPSSNATTNKPFYLMSLRSGSELQYAPASAALGSVILKLPAQNATCTDGSTNYNVATFVLNDSGEMHLYSGGENPPQGLYTDRSGMGQGVFKFSNGTIGRNSEKSPFKIDGNGDLTFGSNNAGFLACPYKDGAYVLWVDVGIEKPAYQDGCLGVQMRAVAATQPVGCVYH